MQNPLDTQFPISQAQYQYHVNLLNTQSGSMIGYSNVNAHTHVAAPISTRTRPISHPDNHTMHFDLCMGKSRMDFRRSIFKGRF